MGCCDQVWPLAVVQRERTVAKIFWLTAAGHQETVEPLLHSRRSLGVISPKQPFNRCGLSFPSHRLLCSVMPLSSPKSGAATKLEPPLAGIKFHSFIRP